MINRSIPGRMSDGELTRLMQLASSVPEHGIVVEVGSLYGLSAWHISKSIPSTATLFCIDPFVQTDSNLEFQRRVRAPILCRESFELYTADCDNIVILQGWSPDVCRGWKAPIDMYFDDAYHTNPVTKWNIDFWTDRVKCGGIVCGHDYSDKFPDVVSNANELALTWKVDLNVTESLWSVRKPC